MHQLDAMSSRAQLTIDDLPNLPGFKPNRVDRSGSKRKGFKMVHGVAMEPTPKPSADAVASATASAKATALEQTQSAQWLDLKDERGRPAGRVQVSLEWRSRKEHGSDNDRNRSRRDAARDQHRQAHRHRGGGASSLGGGGGRARRAPRGALGEPAVVVPA